MFTSVLNKYLRYLQIARYVTLFFQCIEYVRSQRIFGGGVNAMMGAGFPVMAWGEKCSIARVLEHGLSGAKLERLKTAWEAV